MIIRNEADQNLYTCQQLCLIVKTWEKQLSFDWDSNEISYFQSSSFMSTIWFFTFTDSLTCLFMKVMSYNVGYLMISRRNSDHGKSKQTLHLYSVHMNLLWRTAQFFYKKVFVASFFSTLKKTLYYTSTLLNSRNSLGTL